jgi:hypothetical protein
MKKQELEFKGRNNLGRTADEAIDEASKKLFGADNRVHRYCKMNLVYFWGAFGSGLLMLSVYVLLVMVHGLKMLIYFPILSVYWLWVLKFVVPRFESRALDFLNRQYRRRIKAGWGSFVDFLDKKTLISIAKRFRCFTFEKMTLLADLFEQRSKQAQFFFPNPFNSALNAWGSAIFGGLIASLLFEIMKIATPLQLNRITIAVIIFGWMLAIFIFVCNADSRRLSRTAQLLRVAALKAHR